MSQDVGGYRVTVFTAPTPLRVGVVDVSVLVQEAGGGRPLPGSRVTVGATPAARPGQTLHVPATTEAATNKLLHAAKFDLPDPGWWEVEVAVEGERGPARVRFEVEAAEAAPGWPVQWAWLGWPAVVVVLFGVHQVLVWRRDTRGSAPTASPG